MNRNLSIALLVVGLLLVFWGMSASGSFSSGVSKVFTGSPTNKAMWLLIVGAVAAVAGLFGLLRGGKRN